ncbi:MAG: hypothetical protein RIC89_16785 [Pseudomonadales bacterium]
MSDFIDQYEEEDLYELMEDDFDAARFYRALSNALIQLENYDDQAA